MASGDPSELDAAVVEVEVEVEIERVCLGMIRTENRWKITMKLIDKYI